MKKQKSQIKIYFSLLFDNETDMADVTNEIGLVPHSYKNKKEQRKSPFKDDNLEGYWSIETDKIETLELEDVTKLIISMMNPYLNKIKESMQKFEGSADFLIVPDFHHNSTPALCFDRNFLDVVNFLNATIQIDMYVT